MRGPATRTDRHVAFDGYRNPMHDEKVERDRRYGTVYTVVEHANAYLVAIEMPRRIPASSLKQLWKLPDEMPDYDYTVTLHGNVLAVRAGVRGTRCAGCRTSPRRFPPTSSPGSNSTGR